MSEASKTEQTGGQGHSTAALVLSILARDVPACTGYLVGGNNQVATDETNLQP